MRTSAPRKSPCTRFSREGRKCPLATARLDGWCGLCDGFTRPEPPAPGESGRSRYFPLIAPHWTPTAMPLPPEDAYEVWVGRHAVETFTAHHAGTRDLHAEAQIRSLLEDLLRSGRAYGNGPDNYGLTGDGPADGYYLFLALDRRPTVRSYRTSHYELTYAQAKAGITSRSVRRRKPKKKEEDKGDIDAIVRPLAGMGATLTAASQFSALADRADRRRRTPEALTALGEHLRTHVRPLLPPAAATVTGTAPDTLRDLTDTTGLTWTVALTPAGYLAIRVIPGPG